MTPTNIKRLIAGALTVFLTFVLYFVADGIWDKNTIQQYVVYQSLTGGTVEVIDKPGVWMRNFGTTWAYPKTVQKFWSKDAKDGSPGDESIRVTFNDAGTANVGTFIQISLPSEKEKRIALHEKFGGNMDSIMNAVHAHLANCIKNSGPLMTVTENQASRKAEFTQVIEDQLKKGLFAMKRERVLLKDKLDEKGQPMSVEANAIVVDDKGVPLRTEKSPLEEYGLVVNQFSITETEYDELSKQQFAAKQQSYLNAERSKAQREEEIQKKLFVMAEGERQAAEETAKGNVLKAQQTVAGETKVAVAEQAKLEAETLANQKKAVALLEKEAAETKASQEAEVARIAANQAKEVLLTQAEAKKLAAAAEFEAAKLQAQGQLALAEAKAKEIEIAGGVKENEKVLATIAAERDIKVAENLSRIAVPGSIFINGGGNGGANASATGIDPYLVNMTLLKQSGLVNLEAKPVQPAPKVEAKTAAAK